MNEGIAIRPGCYCNENINWLGCTTACKKCMYIPLLVGDVPLLVGVVPLLVGEVPFTRPHAGEINEVPMECQSHNIRLANSSLLKNGARFMHYGIAKDDVSLN